MVFLRQNEDKSMLRGSSLLHLHYTNKDLRQTNQSCCTQVSGVCHGFLKVSCISNKIDPNHLCELVQHHQMISDPMPNQLKLGVIFPA